MKLDLRKWLNTPYAIGAVIALAVLVQGGMYLWQNHHLMYTTPAGAVAWSTLGEAQEFTIDDEGNHHSRSFPPEIKKLDHQQVKIKGYMVTMKPTPTFSEFLLVSTPPTCPYCLQGGATQTIRVITQDSVSSEGDPILVQGRLELQRLSSGVFYELHNAEIIKE
jgi:hypothetical protein